MSGPSRQAPGANQPAPATPILSLENLTISFNTDDGPICVVEDASFTLEAGRTLGLVGESGCGKSVTAQAIMRLLPMPPARIDSGRVVFEGQDLSGLPAARMRALRGDRMAMIFQEPMTSLNPTFTAGAQITEALALHRGLGRGQARQAAIAALSEVGIGSPERRFDQYPHQLSGGLRQRVMIAMALVCRPDLLIADEPTTALDVTVQAQILDLLHRLRADRGLAMLLITHDLGVVEEMCDAIAVMYAGRIIEMGATRDVLRHPRHPYTAGLLEAAPGRTARGERLKTIPGTVPPPGARGAGCSFAGRCDRVLARCRQQRPPLIDVGTGRQAACWSPVP